MFAFLGAMNFAQMIVNSLAVGGGFLVGFLLAWVATWYVDRQFFFKKLPFTLHRASRLTGGTLGAILIALLVFGSGGTGLGGGMGEGFGEGSSPVNTITAATGTPIPSTTPTPGSTTAIPADIPPTTIVRVLILGGIDVQQERFYRTDDAPTAWTLAELKTRLIAKKTAATVGSIGLELRFPVLNTLPQDHPAVTQLVAWARDQQWSVSFPVESAAP
ncbi:MAG: hypothetical protein ACRCZF_19080 [Gemmataceae bacterium]